MNSLIIFSPAIAAVLFSLIGWLIGRKVIKESKRLKRSKEIGEWREMPKSDPTIQYGPEMYWFAWYPIRTRMHGWRWLKWVKRARRFSSISWRVSMWVYMPLREDRSHINVDKS